MEDKNVQKLANDLNAARPITDKILVLLKEELRKENVSGSVILFAALDAASSLAIIMGVEDDTYLNVSRTVHMIVKKMLKPEVDTKQTNV